MKINREELIKSGYKEFPKSGFDSENVKNIYCKWIRDEDQNKLFNITFRLWDWSEYDKCPYDTSFDSSAQYKIKNASTVNVEYFINNDTCIQEVEKFYTDFFEKFNCKGYWE